MKKITIAGLIVIGSMFTAVSGLAQTQHEMRVDVPFAFVVGNKVLPAGNYRIDLQTSPISANEVLIQDVDHPQFAVVVRGTDDGPLQVLPILAASNGRLVFDQYGDDRFLREIRGPFAAINVDIPKSRAEEHVQHRAGIAMASQTTTLSGN